MRIPNTEAYGQKLYRRRLNWRSWCMWVRAWWAVRGRLPLEEYLRVRETIYNAVVVPEREYLPFRFKAQQWGFSLVCFLAFLAEIIMAFPPAAGYAGLDLSHDLMEEMRERVPQAIMAVGISLITGFTFFSMARLIMLTYYSESKWKGLFGNARFWIACFVVFGYFSSAMRDMSSIANMATFDVPSSEGFTSRGFFLLMTLVLPLPIAFFSQLFEDYWDKQKVSVVIDYSSDASQSARAEKLAREYASYTKHAYRAGLEKLLIDPPHKPLSESVPLSLNGQTPDAVSQTIGTPSPTDGASTGRRPKRS